MNTFFATLGFVFLTQSALAAVNYYRVTEVPILGKGGWDDLSVDPEAHRLFVSHSDRVVVIDTDSNKVIKEIFETPGVHGIALALDLKKAFSSNGKENKVSVIDLETLTTKGKIQVGENPDAIIYEPGQKEVYVFNGRSKSVSIIDAKAEKVVATLELSGKPEFAAVDSGGHRIFVNIEDKNSITAIDTQAHKLVATWPLKDCESPTGIAIDVKNHRLFSVCENEKMVMVDANSGKTLASAPTGKGTDGAAFDPENKLAFSSNGKDGTLSIILESTPDKLVAQPALKTQMGARTMTLNPKTHRIYMPFAEFEPATTAGRPKVIDGTQKVLVLGN